jgi:adenylate cyclase
MTTDTFQRKLSAILSADVVGYSRLMGDDEAATVKTLETYKGVMSSLIKQHRGRVVDSPGDNLLAEFGSVVDAVQCAVSIQKELQTRNADLTENRRMEFRIGINLGDVIEEDDRIYGDGVNIAARLEALADPGGICISKTAFDYIENKLPFGYRFIGEQSVKNIAKPIGAYKVLMETRLIDEGDEQKAKAPFWRSKAVLSFGIILILVLGGILYWNFYSREPSIKPDQESTVPDVKEGLKTIAVLPFDDISPDKDQEYFVDGLSEEILNAIDQIPGLTVKARTSSFSFKDQGKTIEEIAGLLGVNYILQGSVRKAGDALRITARLIKVADVSSLWSETYNRELKDIFIIQEDIANSVADKLKLTLEALNLIGGTENIEAYELYLVAEGIKRKPSEFTLSKQGLETIDAALALDPEFADAWIMKARFLDNLSIFETSKLSDMELKAAISSVQKAIEIEPNLASGYFLLGMYAADGGNWIDSELNFQKALKVQSETLTYYEYFMVPTYIAVGYIKKAQDILRETRRNDPLSNMVLNYYIIALGILGDMQGAENENGYYQSFFGDSWKFKSFGITFLRLGKGYPIPKDEIAYSSPIFDAVRGYFDNPKEALNKLHQIYTDDNALSERDITDISILAAYLRDTDFAMKAMERGNAINTAGLFKVWFPVMKEVRQLPRFKEFVREIGLVDYWKEYGWPDLCRLVGDDDFVCD